MNIVFNKAEVSCPSDYCLSKFGKHFLKQLIHLK